MNNLRRSRIAGALLGAGAASALAISAAPANAAAPTGDYAAFAQCPLSVANLSSCFVSDTTSGSIKLGSTTVTINKRIRTQFGYVEDPNTGEDTVYPAANGETLEKTALTVPGGLLGITVPSQLPQPLRGALETAINTENGVTATAELVGTPKFSFNNFLNESSDPTITLPIRVKLDNPFLGSNCYIGSASSPITLKLTDGLSTPPAGVAPIQGTPGSLDFLNNANLVKITGDSLVDNSFSAPKASGCGGPGVSLLLDPVVNLKVGLPAASGVNAARFTGNAQLASADAVRASVR